MRSDLIVGNIPEDKIQEVNEFLEIKMEKLEKLRALVKEYENDYEVIRPMRKEADNHSETDDFSVLDNRGGLKLTLPKMNSNFEKEPEIFIKVMINTLEANKVHRSLWRTYLGASLDGNHRIWYAKMIEGRNIEDWDTIVRMFQDKFAHKDKKVNALKKLATIKQTGNENAGEFIDRFSQLVFDAGLTDTDQSALSSFGEGLRVELKRFYLRVTEIPDFEI